MSRGGADNPDDRTLPTCFLDETLQVSVFFSEPGLVITSDALLEFSGLFDRVKKGQFIVHNITPLRNLEIVWDVLTLPNVMVELQIRHFEGLFRWKLGHR